jgi:hypothetical protein
VCHKSLLLKDTCLDERAGKNLTLKLLSFRGGVNDDVTGAASSSCSTACAACGQTVEWA